jgi:type IV secretion system protein VirB1
MIEELILECPSLFVPPAIMAAVVQTESSGNPFAIGVVNGELVRQPKNLEEAIATVQMLEKLGYNYSLGAAQVNKKNFKRFGINHPKISFDFCKSIGIGSQILNECYVAAKNDWAKAFSCYYSGNFTTGFRHGYVAKVAQKLSNTKVSNRLPMVEHRAISLTSVANKTKSSMTNTLDYSERNKTNDNTVRISNVNPKIIESRKEKLNTTHQDSINIDQDKAFVF